MIQNEKNYTIAKVSLLPALLLCSVAVMEAQPRNAETSDYFRYARKIEGKTTFGERINLLTKSPRAVQALTPNVSISGDDLYGYLEGPDGTTWFYTSDMQTEEVPVDGYYEGYTESYTTGFAFTIYDSNLNKVGTVSDNLVLGEGETRVAQVMLDACISQKFFNSDDKYEIIVSTAYNKDLNSNPYPTVNIRSNAYSIGGAKDADGYDVPINAIDGYVVSTVNAAMDAWSENFYITFMTESADMELDDHIAFLESCKYNLAVYKKAGWGTSPELISTLEVPQTHLPGDQMNAPFFMSFIHDGAAWFALQHYQKRYFEDPAGSSENEAPTADNYLEIKLYSAYGSRLWDEQTTLIPVVQSENEKELYTFYSIGNLGYTEDVDFGNFNGDASKASFVVTKQVYATASDSEYATSYLLYDSEGKMVRTIASEVDGVTPLSDIAGCEPQYVFVYPDESGEDYVFQFVDLYSGNVVATLPRVFEGYQMRGSLDRYPGGESYLWGVSVKDMIVADDGSAFEQVIWIDAAGGFLSHVDKINLGKDVAYAMPYIASHAMSPYLFNSDAVREYMFLVKRYVGDGTATTEELVIGSGNGNTVVTIGADDTKGALATVSLLNTDTTPQLQVLYSDGIKVTQDIYYLPFTKFENGGDGTPENPYIISTFGDLQQIKNDLKAHYRIANNIDAAGETLKPIVGSDLNGFSGTLDGADYIISNLTIAANGNVAAIFGALGNNAVVKDINFENVTIRPSESTFYSGVIAGEVIGNDAESNTALIRDIHVDGLNVEASEDVECEFGGIASYLALYSKVELCSVRNASLNLPGASVGGVVHTTTTSSQVLACAFEGEINAGVNVGGIVARSNSSGDKIEDCHVNAKIVGVNSVGGIVGCSGRSLINRCYAEGSVEAVGPSMWSGACVGGIAGELAADYSATEGATPVISNCVVNLESIKGFETKDKPDYANQYTTIHRIVGKTVINEDPFGQSSMPVEYALANNYAVATLPLGEAVQEAVATGVEGASFDTLTKDFFAGLDYAFGETLESPWAEDENSVVALYFEAIEFSGVENVVVDESEIVIDGNVITAEGSRIAVYSTSGLLVASGVDAVAAENLTKGIYIVVAVATDGTVSSSKFVVR